MSDTAINTHGITMTNGKHAGTLVTRVPVSYLRWMVNKNHDMADVARAEIERRGSVIPEIEVSGHAIDRASGQCLGIWSDTRTIGEGLHAWMMRVTLEAIEKDDRKGDKLRHLGMLFAVEDGEEYPVLKTIMRDKGGRR